MIWSLQDIKNGIVDYPKLKPIKGQSKVSGEIDIINPESGKVLETFEITISFPKNHPHYRLPIVNEISQKIPRNDSRHVYENGVFCLTTALGELLIHKKGITFKEFLDNIVRPFLATQLAISAGWLDGFPQGEYSHGFEGVFESYSEFLDLSDPPLIIAAIKLAFNKNIRNEPCFCKCGKKVKQCHINEIKILRSLDKKQLAKDLNCLIKKEESNTSQNPMK